MNTQVATIEPRRSLIADMAGRYGMEPKAFADTLRATVVPKNASNEEFAAFLLVAKEYDLNPITKEIFAFPKQGGGIQPIVSVDGWANLINSHPQCDGWEFEDHLNDKGELSAVTCRMYRKDRTHSMEATEYMAECRRKTSTWDQWPRRMLRHKSLIQAARYAFGFAGIVDQDEAERMTPATTSNVTRLTPPPAPPVGEPNEVAVQPEAVDQYRDWLSDCHAELAACQSDTAVEDLRDRALLQMEDADIQDWKDACAARATELFKGGK